VALRKNNHDEWMTFAGSIGPSRGCELTETRIKGIFLNSNEVLMPKANDLLEKARMFDQRAEQANDPISRQHYREMAAQYRCLSIEHRLDPAMELAQ